MASQRNRLNPIKDIFPTVKVEGGEEVIGHTKAGNMVVRRKVRRFKKELVLNADGTQRHRLNAIGHAVTPMHKLIAYEVWDEYEKIPTRDGGVRKNRGYKPDPEEQARIERRKKIAENRERLDELMVDNNIGPEALVNVLMEAETAPAPKRTAKAG